MQGSPRLIVVAGPNGAGKSTYSRGAFGDGFLLLDPDRYGVRPGIRNPIAAGRLVVRRAHDALVGGESFVLETTLSGRFPLTIVRTARERGFEVTLLYVGIDDPEECIRRVRRRVALGGTTFLKRTSGDASDAASPPCRKRSRTPTAWLCTTTAALIPIA